MRRVLLGLILGALIFGVAFAGAKVATVTNPMSADLDGGGHNIANVVNFQSAGGAQIGGAGVTAAENVLVDNLATPSVFVSDLVGTADPSVTGLDRNPGSVYRQQVGGQFGTGALWLKTGACATCWAKVATVP